MWWLAILIVCSVPVLYVGLVAYVYCRILRDHEPTHMVYRPIGR